MYATGKSWPFGWKIDSCHNKKRLFEWENIGITSLWEDLEDKLLTPGQLLGKPWNFWGVIVQTSYVEGRWHQNWGRSRPTKVKWKFVKNWKLLFGLELENEERYCSGPGKVKGLGYIGEQMPLDEKWLRALFDRVLPARSWEMPVERELQAKIGQC